MDKPPSHRWTAWVDPLALVALGFLGGLFVTAPLGPVNIMVMQRAFRFGFPVESAAGAGAAVTNLAFA